MPSAKKEGEGEHSVLNELLALRLQQLEEEHGGYEAFAPLTGVAKGTLYAIAHAKGNPTFRTIERIASKLDMSVLELLGLDVNDARQSLKRNGIDYDELVAAIRIKNKADLRVARKARALK